MKNRFSSKTFKLSMITNKMITISGSGRYSVKDSYLILCLTNPKRTDLKNCRPILVHERGISCECDVRYQLTTFVILLVFWILTLAIMMRPLLDLFKEQKEEKTDFGMPPVSCQVKNAPFEYVIGLRMAKESTDFDMNDVNIDIQFFSDKEPVGEKVLHISSQTN